MECEFVVLGYPKKWGARLSWKQRKECSRYVEDGVEHGSRDGSRTLLHVGVSLMCRYRML